MSPVVLADSGPAVKIFVLDTNVLMHDPSALFKFQEHHVYLPMTVLEELDNAKVGVSEVARNVRQTNRFIDELLTAQKQVVIEEGLQLNQFTAAEEPFKCSGRLFFQTQAHDSSLPKSLPGNKNDNSILNTIMALKQDISGHEITLISKDINLRIKAAILGIGARCRPMSGKLTASRSKAGRMKDAPTTKSPASMARNGFRISLFTSVTISKPSCASVTKPAF